MAAIQHIADRYGNGTVHMMTRQGFEIPDVPMTDIDAVNREAAINWLREAPLLEIIGNTYRYIEKYIDTRLDKEHVGYILDRTGYKVFRDNVLQGVALNPQAEVADRLEFKGDACDV